MDTINYSYPNEFFTITRFVCLIFKKCIYRSNVNEHL